MPRYSPDRFPGITNAIAWRKRHSGQPVMSVPSWIWRRASTLGTELLEDRRLLSVASGVTGRVLAITGTDSADRIEVRYDAADILIEYSTFLDGGAVQQGALRHAASQVGEIHVRGLNGDDVLDASRIDLPTTLSGDAGKDDLIGGSGNDSLNGGPDDDRLDGRGGIDVIVASEGSDIATVVWSQVSGAFLNPWLAAGGEGGQLGAPVDNKQDCTGGVESQRFSRGLIYQSSRTGTLVVPSHLPPAAQSVFDEAYDPVRSELLTRFFFNGFIADRIWSVNGEAHIKFGDQGKQMGDALLLFAQEAAILQSAGYDPAPSENIIKIILNAFDQMDRDGEIALYGQSRMASGIASGEVRGFFLRDYVGTSSLERQGIPQAVYEDRIYSDFLNGIKGREALREKSGSDHGNIHKYTDPVLSADQAAHLMSGWWAVTKYSTSADNASWARDQTRRVMDYWISVGYVLPPIEGVEVKPNRGADARLNAGFLSHMADKVTGDGYFWQTSNGIYVGDVNSGAIRDAIRQAVQIYVDASTAGLTWAARRLFNWDPVADVVNALTARIPDWTRVEIPVWFAHNTLLVIADQTGPLWEPAEVDPNCWTVGGLV